MKNLIQLVTALILFLLVQTNGFSQTSDAAVNSTKEDTTTEMNTDLFIGTYLLAEADLQLEIIEEDDKMYLVSSFSKDILIPKNNNTLHELTRGVDLELIANDKSALKFTQNGYETTIKRVMATTEK